MPGLRRLVRRLSALVTRSRFESELDEEIRLHLDELTARLRAEGLPEAEARRRAVLEFGAVESFREEAREARGLQPLDDLARDLRLGACALRRRPGFTAAVVLTLGVGVGGCAAIFGAIDGMLLTPLPYADAERIVAVWQHDRTAPVPRQDVAPANFLDWRERSRAFERLTAMEPFGLDWLGPEGPVYLPAWLVYEGFFDVLRTPPLLGRTPGADEHVAGRADVVVLGYGLWKSRFAGQADVVGRVLTLDGRAHIVVGVMPEGFAMPSDDVVWAPKLLTGSEKQQRSGGFYSVFGRLRPGVTLAEAEADLGAVAAQLAREHPRSNADVGVSLVPLAEQIVGGARKALLLLLGAVLLVLAVVTSSAASMQLARAASRAREFALRSALGAGPGRVARELLAEGLILAALGAALGCALAHLILDGVRALAPTDLPRLSELRADPGVFAFAACLSLLAVLATGIAPSLLAARAKLQPGLAQGGRGATRGGWLARAQAGLVLLQLCTTLVLLIGAGLLLRSFASLLAEPGGFRSDGVVALTVQSWGYFTKPAERAAFVAAVLERVRSEPGVQAAGMTSSVPLMDSIGAEQAPLELEGAPALGADESPPLVSYAVVSPGFLETLAIPLRAGRRFEARDQADAPQVALVNEAFVRQHSPGRDPIGRRLALSRSAARNQGPSGREIVGVVGDVRRDGLHEAARPCVYLPHPQSPSGANAFVARGDRTPAELLQAIRRAVWQLSPAMPVYRETTLAEVVGASVRERRFLMALLTGFAGMALALAAARALRTDELRDGRAHARVRRAAGARRRAGAGPGPRAQARVRAGRCRYRARRGRGHGTDTLPGQPALPGDAARRPDVPAGRARPARDGALREPLSGVARGGHRPDRGAARGLKRLSLQRPGAGGSAGRAAAGRGTGRVARTAAAFATTAGRTRASDCAIKLSAGRAPLPKTNTCTWSRLRSNSASTRPARSSAATLPNRNACSVAVMWRV